MSAILYGLLQQLRGLPARVQALEDGGAGGAAAIFDEEVTDAAQVDITGLDGSRDTLDVYLDGVLEQGGVARWVSLFPNGSGGVNPGHVARATLQRSWTDSGGNLQQPASVRTDEHGLVFALLPFTSDHIISAEAHVNVKTGKPRVAHTSLASASMDAANVNETSLQSASARWDETTEEFTHLVVDFGGGTFTGRVTVR